MEDPRVGLRPHIATTEADSPVEQFQNQTLRPVLKMQNALILQLYRHFLTKRKVPFSGFSLEKRQRWIEDSLSQDNRLRGLLLGLVIGQFTEVELVYYLSQESEMNRRIFTMMAQRLQSQMDQLTEDA